MTQQELEVALDSGMLEVRMSNGRWWKARRNGVSKSWSTKPGYFEIPCKIGFNSYMTLTPADISKDPSDLRVVS